MTFAELPRERVPRSRGSLLVVRNPRAHRAPPEVVLSEAARRLQRAGWDIDVRSTTAAGHATELAREAAGAGVDAVLACGGDGTAREVVEGIVHTGTALGVLPAGTANVWAHEAGVPLRLEAALALAVRARRVRVDTGIANGRRFLLMCSAGLDAAVVREVEGGARKRFLGRAAFVAPAVQHALGERGIPARIEVDGAELERSLLLAVAGNSRLYGGVARLTAGASMDDGLLDVCALSSTPGDGLGRRSLRAWQGAWGRLEATAERAVDVDYLRAARLSIEAETPLAVQADGEFIGETPLQLEVDPGSLSVLVAPGANPLFA